MKLKTKTLEDFTPEEIQRRRRTKELRKARCKLCELHRPNTAQGRAGHCRMCDKLIAVSHFHQYAAATNDGICRRCWRKMQEVDKATANMCPQCSQPLKKGATPGSWCPACAYPPCAGCRKVPRPGKGSNHAKHRLFWRCKACAADICPKCQRNPVGQQAGPPPTGCCPECAEKHLCAACNKPCQLNPKSHGWCPACAYPPCNGGCGTSRPSTRIEYHAKTLPQWTCQTCLQVQKPHPQQPKSRAPAHPDDSAKQAEPLPPLPPPPEPPPEQPGPAAFGNIPKRRKRTVQLTHPQSTPANVPLASQTLESEALASDLTLQLPVERPTTAPPVPGDVAGRPTKRPRRAPAAPRDIMCSLPAELPEDDA